MGDCLLWIDHDSHSTHDSNGTTVIQMTTEWREKQQDSVPSGSMSSPVTISMSWSRIRILILEISSILLFAFIKRSFSSVQKTSKFNSDSGLDWLFLCLWISETQRQSIQFKIRKQEATNYHNLTHITHYTVFLLQLVDINSECDGKCSLWYCQFTRAEISHMEWNMSCIYVPQDSE